MKRKQIIIILCVLLVVCSVAIGVQAHNARIEKPTETNSISQQAESTTEPSESTSAGESTTAAESTSAGGAESTTGETTSKGQTTKPSTTAKQTTTANQTTTTKPITTTTAAPKQISVSFSITCHNAVGKTDKAPASGVIMSSATYTAQEGATVFDALKALCSQKGISLNYKNAYYIQGIGGLNEKDCGSGSGWMYRVNGSTPMTACNKYKLKDGDKVEWYYVTNSTDN